MRTNRSPELRADRNRAGDRGAGQFLDTANRRTVESAEVRDTVKFAYGSGGASLLDFLDAQKSYRDTQLNYLNLLGSYLSAVNQLNLAVGREVMP